MGGKGRILNRQGGSPGCWLNGGCSTLNHKWFIDHCLASTRAFERDVAISPRGLFLKSVAENAFQSGVRQRLGCQVMWMGAVWEEICWSYLGLYFLEEEAGPKGRSAYPKQIKLPWWYNHLARQFSPVLKFEGAGPARELLAFHSLDGKKKIKVLLKFLHVPRTLPGTRIEVWTRYSFCPPEAHKLAGEDREVHVNTLVGKHISTVSATMEAGRKRVPGVFDGHPGGDLVMNKGQRTKEKEAFQITDCEVLVRWKKMPCPQVVQLFKAGVTTRWLKRQTQPAACAFVIKVLFSHSSTHVSTYCPWLICITTGVEFLWQRTWDPESLKYYTGPKKVVWAGLRVATRLMGRRTMKGLATKLKGSLNARRSKRRIGNHLYSTFTISLSLPSLLIFWVSWTSDVCRTSLSDIFQAGLLTTDFLSLSSSEKVFISLNCWRYFHRA